MTHRFSTAMAMAIAALAGNAQADTDLTFSGKAEAIVTYYGKDMNGCWNDGSASCKKTRTRLQGDNYLRVDGVSDLSDDVTLVFRGQASAYLNNAFYTVTEAAKGGGNSSTNFVDYSDSPHVQAELEDTWVGLRHLDFGTVRAGRGLNPRMKALEGDGTTDLGGREMLDLMVAYDSPYVIGDKSHGLTFSYANYKGARMRKEIRVLHAAEEDSRNKTEPRGNSLLLDGTWFGALTTRAAIYHERYTARQWRETGRLDGIYSSDTLFPAVPGSGALTSSQGASLLASYEFSSFRVGASASRNQVNRVQMVNPAFPAVGYRSRQAAVFLSAWHGPWSLWARANFTRFSLSADTVLPEGYAWIYSNDTRDLMQVGGEVSYEFAKGTRAVVGVDVSKTDFKEAPGYGGLCAPGRSRECYDPFGAKASVGVRTNF